MKSTRHENRIFTGLCALLKRPASMRSAVSHSDALRFAVSRPALTRFAAVFSAAILAVSLLTGCIRIKLRDPEATTEASASPAAGTAQGSGEPQSGEMQPGETLPGETKSGETLPGETSSSSSENETEKPTAASGDTSEKGEKDASASIDPKTLFGEAADPAFAGLYILKNSQELPAHDAVINTLIASDRVLMNLVRDDRMYAAVLDLRTLEWTVTDLGRESHENGAYETLNDGTEQWVSWGHEYKPLYAIGDEYACMFDAGTLIFYDRDMKCLATVEVPVEEIIAGDGYAAGFSDGVLHFWFPDGTECSAGYPEAKTALLSQAEADSLTVTVSDSYNNYRILKVGTDGTVLDQSGVLDSRGGIRGSLVTYRETDGRTTVFSGEGAGRVYELGNDDILCAVDNGFVTACYDMVENGDACEMTCTLRRYTYDSVAGRELAQLQGPYLFVDSYVMIGDHLVFSDSTYSDHPNFYVLEIPAEAGAGAAPQTEDAEHADETGLARFGSNDFYTKKTYENASEVWYDYNELGIGIYYEGNVLNTDFIDYFVAMSNDAAELEIEKQKLRSFFAGLPEGFLDEVIYGVGGLDVYLVADIMPKSGGNGIDSVAAFTNTIDGRYVMVIDINMLGIDNTIAHEFMHLIERTMNVLCSYNAFEDWDALNPADFMYYRDYHLEDGSEVNSGTSPEYTPDWEPAWYSAEEIWFIDGYGKTYPEEDRARLFEYLYTGDCFYMTAYDSSHVRAKAEYLCACIRDAFPSLAACETACWEAYLR